MSNFVSIGFQGFVKVIDGSRLGRLGPKRGPKFYEINWVKCQTKTSFSSTVYNFLFFFSFLLLKVQISYIYIYVWIKTKEESYSLFVPFHSIISSTMLELNYLRNHLQNNGPHPIAWLRFELRTLT